MAKTVTGRVGWEVAKKLIKAIPYVGAVVSVVFAGHAIRKKGLLPGAVHVGLDVTPVVGTAKNVIEIVTGDWIPDKPSAKAVSDRLSAKMTTSGGTMQQPAERAEEYSPGQAQRRPG
jgi:S1-C subfamily serine protease